MRMYLNFFLISLSCSFDYSNNRIANSGGSNNLFFAKFTIAIGLQFFKGSQGNVQMGQMMAMSLVALLPVLVIFVTCQKYFIQGIKMSGLKG